MRSAIAAAGLAVGLVAGFAAAGTGHHSSGRWALADAMASGAPVFVVRVENKPSKDRTQGIDGYAVLSRPRPLSPDQTRRLQDLFREDKRFDAHHAASACGFFPGFAFRVGRDGEKGNVLICFDCNEIKVVDFGKDSYESSCHARRALIDLLRSAMPDDAQLAQLDADGECYF